MTAILEVLGALLASYALAFSLWSLVYGPRRTRGPTGRWQLWPTRRDSWKDG